MVLVEEATLLGSGWVCISSQGSDVDMGTCYVAEKSEQLRPPDWCSQGVALHCQRELLNYYMALNSKPTSSSTEQWA